MKKFKRRGTTITSHLSPYEVHLLANLLRQLIDMVSDGDPQEFTSAGEEPDDPFEAWARDLSETPDQPEEAEDPVVRRLFPDAYPHDAAASADFRRFTERDLRTKKVLEAQRVQEQLAASEDGLHPVAIPVAEVDVWLRTLTALRLAVATRLGISDAESADELAMLAEDDPRAFMVSVYEWLGFAQETLVSAL